MSVDYAPLRSANALVLEAPRRLESRSFPVPDVCDDDAILRVEACGLCGTDHEQYTGVLPAAFAFIPGHESVGVIEAIGPAASARWEVDAGDRVAVEVFLSCRSCDQCHSGNYNRCVSHGLRDMYGFISTEKPPSLWGGYSTHQYLAPDSIVHKVPDGVDPVLATLFNPLGAGIRWGVTVPETGEGDVVCVLGPGIRGLSAVVAA
jgi:alcohol dehydrogenase